MFSMNSIMETKCGNELLEAAKGYISADVSSIEKVDNAINDIADAIRLNLKVPEFIIKKDYYDNNGDGKLKYMTFDVKMSKKEKLDDLQKCQIVVQSDSPLETFVVKFAEWVDRCNRYKLLNKNISELNYAFKQIVEEEGIPYTVAFAISNKKIVDISDTSVVFGMSEDAASKIGGIALYAGLTDEFRDGYRKRIADTLKLCERPFKLLKLKNSVTDDLGIYTRIGVVKVIRSFVSRKAENVRDGFGYIEDDNSFALVNRYFVSEGEAAQLKKELGAPIDSQKQHCENKKMADKSLIVSYFKLSPFSKETLENAEMEVKF